MDATHDRGRGAGSAGSGLFVSAATLTSRSALSANAFSPASIASVSRGCGYAALACARRKNAYLGSRGAPELFAATPLAAGAFSPAGAYQVTLTCAGGMRRAACIACLPPLGKVLAPAENRARCVAAP